MATQSYWRSRSNKVIDQAYRELRPMMPDASIDEICKKISLDCYPFGPRSMHPYHIWLSAIRQFKDQLNGNNADTKNTKEADPNQLDLFAAEE